MKWGFLTWLLKWRDNLYVKIVPIVQLSLKKNYVFRFVLVVSVSFKGLTIYTAINVKFRNSKSLIQQLMLVFVQKDIILIVRKILANLVVMTVIHVRQMIDVWLVIMNLCKLEEQKIIKVDAYAPLLDITKM